MYKCTYEMTSFVLSFYRNKMRLCMIIYKLPFSMAHLQHHFTSARDSSSFLLVAVSALPMTNVVWCAVLSFMFSLHPMSERGAGGIRIPAASFFWDCANHMKVSWRGFKFEWWQHLWHGSFPVGRVALTWLPASPLPLKGLDTLLKLLGLWGLTAGPTTSYGWVSEQDF